MPSFTGVILHANISGRDWINPIFIKFRLLLTVKSTGVKLKLDKDENSFKFHGLGQVFLDRYELGNN